MQIFPRLCSFNIFYFLRQPLPYAVPQLADGTERDGAARIFEVYPFYDLSIPRRGIVEVSEFLTSDFFASL